MEALEPEEEGATQFKLNAYIEGRRVKTGNPPTRNSEEPKIFCMSSAFERLLQVMLVSLLTSGIFSQGNAEDSAPKKFTSQLQEISKGLNSEHHKRRVDASKLLTEHVNSFGPALEVALLEWAKGQSAEVRASARRELSRIEKMGRDAKLFAEYDKRGLPSAKGRRYGRVATGWFEFGKKKEKAYSYGFLVAKKTEWIEIVEDLEIESISRDALGGVERTRFEPLDYIGTIKDLIHEYMENIKKSDDLSFHLYPRGPSRTELFLAARNAHALNLFGQSLQLMRCAERTNSRRGDSGKEFVEELRKDFEYELTWGAVRACGYMDRPRLLKTFLRILKSFPKSMYEKQVLDIATQLKIMIQEDREDARATPKAWKDMTRPEKLKQLVFNLREQDGRQFSQPGTCSVLNEWGYFVDGVEKKISTPAHKLLNMGFDAVPVLIDLLDNRRLTRAIGYGRDFLFSHHVLRNGDCALEILEQMAGRRFSDPKSSCSYLTNDGDIPRVRKAVEEWWQAIQKKGEKQVLVEAVRRADRDSTVAAHRLAKIDSRVATDETAKAMRSSKDVRFRTSLAQFLSDIPEAQAIPHLLSESKGPCRSTRLIAIRALYHRKRPEAVQAAMDEVSGKAAAPEMAENFAEGGSAKGFALFLLETGQTDAIRCVVNAYTTLSVDTQAAIIEKCDEIKWGNKEVTALLEKMLVAALDDDVRCRLQWVRSYSDPLLQELAALVLSKRWKRKPTYTFDLGLLERRNYLTVLKNIWRKKQGRAPLPMPVPTKATPTDPEHLVRLAKNLLAAKSIKQIASILELYERIGISALTPLREAMRNLPKYHRAHGPGRQTLARITSIVRTATLHRTSLPLPGMVNETWNALEGKPLTAEALFPIFKKICKRKMGSLEFSLERGNETETVLSIHLRDRDPSASIWTLEDRNKDSIIHASFDFTLGKHSLSGTNTMTTVEEYRGASGWDFVKKRFSRILEAPPEKKGRILIRLDWRE